MPLSVFSQKCASRANRDMAETEAFPEQKRGGEKNVTADSTSAWEAPVEADEGAEASCPLTETESYDTEATTGEEGTGEAVGQEISVEMPPAAGNVGVYRWWVVALSVLLAVVGLFCIYLVRQGNAGHGESAGKAMKSSGGKTAIKEGETAAGKTETDAAKAREDAIFKKQAVEMLSPTREDGFAEYLDGLGQEFQLAEKAFQEHSLPAAEEHFWKALDFADLILENVLIANAMRNSIS